LRKLEKRNEEEEISPQKKMMKMEVIKGESKQIDLRIVIRRRKYVGIAEKTEGQFFSGNLEIFENFLKKSGFPET